MPLFFSLTFLYKILTELFLSTMLPQLVWKVGRVYEYDYSGFLSTGMMGISPIISGGSISGRLTVEPVDHSTINIAVSLTNMK